MLIREPFTQHGSLLRGSRRPYCAFAVAQNFLKDFCFNVEETYEIQW